MARHSRCSIMKAALPHTSAFHVIFRFVRREHLAKLPVHLCSLFVSVMCALLHYPALRWHSYVVMPSHMHNDISIVSGGGGTLSQFLHRCRSRFARLVQAHDVSKRLGCIFGQRAATIPKRAGMAVLMDMMYHHYNPVAAGLVDAAEDWIYSSHNFYARGEIRHLHEFFLTPPPEYMALGRTPAERQETYRQLFAAFSLVMEQKAWCRGLTSKWKVVGDEEFRREFYAKLQELADAEPVGSAGVAGTAAGMTAAARRRAMDVLQAVERAVGDPDPEQFAGAELPACCWMLMSERQRLELKTLIGDEFRAFRLPLKAGALARMFVPSAELRDKLGDVPEGFAVNLIAGEFVGLRDLERAARDKRRRRSAAGAVSPEARDSGQEAAADVDGGALSDGDGQQNVGASREESGQEGVVRPDAVGAEMAELAPQVERGVECAQVPGAELELPAAAAVSASAEGPGKAQRRGSARQFDISAWWDDHKEVLLRGHFEYELMVEILLGPKEPLRLRRRTEADALVSDGS